MDWEKRLISNGYRMTAPRRAVVQVLREETTPLQPRAILERAERIHTSLGIVTVYRTLALLAEFGFVRRVHQDDGCSGYVLSSPGHRHHIICRGCGGSEEFVGADDIDLLIDRVETRTKYQVEDHLLQLVGLCPHCQNQMLSRETSEDE